MSDNKTTRSQRKPLHAAVAAGEPGVPRTPPATVEPEPAVEPPVETAAVERERPAPAAAGDSFAYAQDALDALSKAQSAVGRGFDAAAVEVAALARSGIAAFSDAAIAMLGVRTLADAIEVGGGFAKRTADVLIESSVKLSEIGAKTAAEASRPILAEVGAAWENSRSA